MSVTEFWTYAPRAPYDLRLKSVFPRHFTQPGSRKL